MSVTRREVVALGTLAVILLITASWWALALWPLSGDAPGWVVRTRAVCFGSTPHGLPTTAGWMALIGQPVYMLATLWLISGRTVANGLRHLARVPGGRLVLIAGAVLGLSGMAAAGVRVANASTPSAPGVSLSAGDVPRRDEPAPPLTLLDQHGAEVTVARFRGRPIFVTFAFAHCETICPLTVQDLLHAQASVAELDPVVLVVTLDPWRDAPARLAAIADQWHLGRNAYVLSGEVAHVERTLDAWHVGRARDGRTGDVTHATAVYLLDRAGRVAFVVAGGADATTLAELARRL